MKNNGKPLEKIYQKKTQLEHILLRPDTYVGSIELQKDKLWVFNSETKKLEFREVSYVPGLFKIFDEILVNAADNFQRDNSMSLIEVNIDPENNKISVKNNGAGIPIQIHKEYNIYIPELIFGQLLTSSNYNDEDKKVTGGRNGYGAKLTNIFSKLFIVETADSKSKKNFRQVYKNNMSSCESPVITNYSKEDYTCITFVPDLDKFKMKALDQDIVALMMKRVYDMAGVTDKKVKVYLNGKKLEVKDFNSYIDLFLDSEEHKETDVVFEKPHERWEIGVALSEGQFQTVSYVNAISTSKGGTHVNYVIEKIVEHVLENMAKKYKNLNIKPHNVRQHLWVFVNCLIENPSFDSQTKENMTLKASSFGSSFDFSEKFLKAVLKLGIIDHCVRFAKTREELKMTKQLNAGTRKQARLLGIAKLEDANNAGTKNSEECTLILTEGDSAKTLAMAGIEVVGRDNFGVFPLKGKLLNVREANANQISKNDEIQNLMKIIGLQIGKKYEETKSLRYGSIMIMTDQDNDGSHIKGLIINMIHHFWPSLIQMNGFMKEFITPIIKATKGNNIETFYTIHEYKQWCESINNNTKGWKIKYYKGLGTSTDKEAQEYFASIDKNKIEFYYEDNYDDEAIDLAFNKKKTEERKNWLANYDPNNVLDSTDLSLRYQDFINKEFILYSISDNQRSIPSLCDGLKPSERKILYACFKRKLKDEIKVAQLSGYVAEHSAYHHGEMSLCATIVALAQSFVGSNNINILMPLGQFGTRNQGGKEAASARYIFTNLNKVTRHIFNESDDPLLDYIVEEGQRIEPIWYLPIIPMILVNGADGIGTGWSTSIPCYNPREIVNNIRCKIKTGNFEDMTPWYKGYQGKIEKNGKGSYTVTGKFEWLIKGDSKILVITELPIKKWTKDYKDILEKYMGLETKKEKEEEKKKKKKKKENEESEEESKKENVKVIVEDFKEYHTNNRVHFEIKLLDKYVDEYMNDSDLLMKKFKLQTTINVSNMVLFDKNLKIRKYGDIIEILEEFYELRLNYYERRKNYLLSSLKRDLEILDNKARFIIAVINEEIIIKRAKKKELINVLLKNGYTPMSKINKIKIKSSIEDENQNVNENQDEDEDGSIPAKEFDYLLSMPLWSLTYEKVEELLKNKENKIKEIEILSCTSEKTFWENDLTEFIRVLDEVEEKEEADRKGSNKIRKANAIKGKGRVKGNKNKNIKDMIRDRDIKTEKKNLVNNETKDDKINKNIKEMKIEKDSKPLSNNKFESPTETKDITKLSLIERLAMKNQVKEEETINFISSKSKQLPENLNFHNENGKRRKNLIISDSDDSDFENLINGQKLDK